MTRSDIRVDPIGAEGFCATLIGLRGIYALGETADRAAENLLEILATRERMEPNQIAIESVGHSS